MTIERLTLNDYGGLGQDAVIVKRTDGSKFVRFEIQPSRGFPTLEEKELESLLDRLRVF